MTLQQTKHTMPLNKLTQSQYHIQSDRVARRCAQMNFETDDLTPASLPHPVIPDDNRSVLTALLIPLICASPPFVEQLEAHNLHWAKEKAILKAYTQGTLSALSLKYV